MTELKIKIGCEPESSSCDGCNKVENKNYNEIWCTIYHFKIGSLSGLFKPQRCMQCLLDELAVKQMIKMADEIKEPPIKMTFVNFLEESNEYNAVLLDGSIIKVDPTVGCAIIIDIEEHNEDYRKIARSYLGKTFIAEEYCFSADGVMIPSEGHFKELKEKNG